MFCAMPSTPSAKAFQVIINNDRDKGVQNLLKIWWQKGEIVRILTGGLLR